MSETILPNYSVFKKIMSFLVPVLIHKSEGETGQMLEIWLINGRLVLDSGNANYSFGSLHRVMQKAIKASGIKPSATEKLLLLGLGGGSVINILRNELKTAVLINAVEFDKRVIGLAEQFFNVLKYTNVEIIHNDAFEFVANRSWNFNYVIMDVFDGTHVPEKFLSIGYLENLNKFLYPGGTLIFNTMLGERELLLSAFRNEFKNVFPKYKEMAIGDENVVFIGYK